MRLKNALALADEAREKVPGCRIGRPLWDGTRSYVLTLTEPSGRIHELRGRADLRRVAPKGRKR